MNKLQLILVAAFTSMLLQKTVIAFDKELEEAFQVADDFQSRRATSGVNAAESSLNKAGVFDLLHKPNIDINTPNANGETALNALIKTFVALTAVKKLVALGADINKPDNDGNTPLHHAADKDIGDDMAEFLDELLKLGANPLAKNVNGELPIDIIHRTYQNKRELKSLNELLTKYTYEQIVKAFKNRKYSTEELEGAIRLGFVDLVEQLLKTLTLTHAQLSTYGKIAENRFTQTHDRTYLEIGKLLRYHSILSTLSHSTPPLPTGIIRDMAQYPMFDTPLTIDLQNAVENGSVELVTQLLSKVRLTPEYQQLLIALANAKMDEIEKQTQSRTPEYKKYSKIVKLLKAYTYPTQQTATDSNSNTPAQQ